MKWMTKRNVLCALPTNFGNKRQYVILEKQHFKLFSSITYPGRLLYDHNGAINLSSILKCILFLSFFRSRSATWYWVELFPRILKNFRQFLNKLRKETLRGNCTIFDNNLNWRQILSGFLLFNTRLFTIITHY